MTSGQMMVWAAVLAKELDISNPPRHVLEDETQWSKWEDNRLITAIEQANHVVKWLETIGPQVKEAMGGETDSYITLMEMIQ